MKPTNQKTLTVTAMRIVFPLCLALTCLSKPAAAITIGPADGKVTCDRTTCSSDTKLPAGPGPGSGGAPINPNDYGMCGLLQLSGTFDSSTVARIIAGADGYYHVHRAWATSDPTGPTVELTCVLFTEFTGLPYDFVAGLSTFQPPVVTATSGGKASNDIGPNGACIWAGLAGALSAKDTQASTAVFAQVDGLYTLDFVQSAPKTTDETYAFCTAIPGFSWGPYLHATPVPAQGGTGGLLLAVKPASRHWCYMDGVGTSAGGTFNDAGLGFVLPYTYYFGVHKESELWFNCLNLDQTFFNLGAVHGPDEIVAPL